MKPLKTLSSLAIFTYFAIGGFASLWAQTLPEVAVERSRGLCGAGHKLIPVIDEIGRAVQAHQMGGGGGGTTDPAAAAAGSGLRNVDYGDIAVIEDQGDLLVHITYKGQGGPPYTEYTTHSKGIAKKFYETHNDQYDTIVIFTASTFADDPEPESGFAFSMSMQNTVGGIGLSMFNYINTVDLPPSGTLKNIVNMNDLGEFAGAEGEIPGFTGVTGIEVLGQEVGHRWGSFVNTNVADVLGRGQAHWSFFLDTGAFNGSLIGAGASVMEGNRWQANGDGSFTTGRPFDSYSLFDLYVMGMLDLGGAHQSLRTQPVTFVQEEAPTDPSSGPGNNGNGKGGGKKKFEFARRGTTLHEHGGDGGGSGRPCNPRSPNCHHEEISDSAFPQEGMTVQGSGIPVTIQDIINANGPRTPARDPLPARLAFILVVPDDGGATTVTPSPADLNEMNEFRTKFQLFFSQHTNGLGSVSTGL